MKTKTVYILVVIVIILAIAIWGAFRVKAPEGETEVLVEGEMPAEGEGLVPGAPKIEESPLGEFNPEAPVQTAPLVEEELSEAVIKLNMTTNGIEPKEFTVKAGQTVSLAITSLDATHVFKFDDPGLSNIVVGLARTEMRGISFKAPAEKGDYTFFCDVPGHLARGETGVMHVK